MGRDISVARLLNEQAGPEQAMPEQATQATPIKRPSYKFVVKYSAFSRYRNEPKDPRLLPLMERFFAERFEEKHGAVLATSRIFEMFATGLPMVEQQRFRFHYRRMFQAQWKGAKLTKVNNQACFRHVREIQ